MPDSSPTIALREPTRRLNRVLLPTFGRPTIARVPATGRSPVGGIRRDSYMSLRDIDVSAFASVTPNDYYREARSFHRVFSLTIRSRRVGRNSRSNALSVLRPWGRVSESPPCLRVPPAPTADARS